MPTTDPDWSPYWDCSEIGLRAINMTRGDLLNLRWTRQRRRRHRLAWQQQH